MMTEFSGWLLDIYEHPADGVIVWFIDEQQKERRCVRASFTVRIYPAGAHGRLRELWRFLRGRELPVELSRQTKTELFAGEIDVMGIGCRPIDVKRVGCLIEKAFPDLVYYDVDIPLALRYAAVTGAKPLVMMSSNSVGTSTLSGSSSLISSAWLLSSMGSTCLGVKLSTVSTQPSATPS